MAMVSEFKVINAKRNVGVWLDTNDFINLIKICDNRNKFYKDKLIADLEYLTGEKFDKHLIKKSNHKYTIPKDGRKN